MITAQQKTMKFSIKDFFSKYYQICKKTADLVTITEEILYGKFQFLCSRSSCICFRKKPRKVHVRTYVVNLEGHSTNLKELVVSGLKNEYVMITHITKFVLYGAKRSVLEIVQLNVVNTKYLIQSHFHKAYSIFEVHPMDSYANSLPSACIIINSHI